MARWASLATVGNATYLAGTDLLWLDSTTVPSNPLVVAKLGGHSIGRPTGDFRFPYPKLLADRRGRLHLVWAVAADETLPIQGDDWTSLSWPGRRFIALWTSTFDPSRGWSSPRELLRLPDGIGWNSLTRVEQDASTGKQNLLVPVDLHHLIPGRLAIVQFDHDSLVTRPAQILEGVFYLSLASAGRDFHLAYIGELRNRDSDRSAVYLQQSRDGGATWGEARVVSASGGATMHEVQAGVSPDGHLHLVWQEANGSAPQIIRHVESADGGRSWSTPSDLHPRAQAADLQTVIDSCGVLHLIYSDWDPSKGRPHIDYATWNRGWSTAEQLFPNLGVWELSFSRAPDGRLDLVFMGVARSSSNDTPTTTLRSERRAK